ncbi:MAG TPA: DNA topoisomerase I, partial [Prolixibacteraceae bacterium]|nr:DNA topoisomerase I [Prolixibacteraceae bacterium]
YMRTDSVNLSSLAINTTKSKILEMHGEKYLHSRQYKTKSKGAQEAHEAIRPTYIDKEDVSGSAREKKLYELIWKRTIASQMSDAELEKTTVTINISSVPEKFIASGEVLVFDGFLKVYMESVDDEETNGDSKGLLPPLKANQQLRAGALVATERFSIKPPRYTEASLVKKLEEQGIGRPSTYAPTITTIQNRGYVVKEDRDGVQRNYLQITLLDGKISESVKTEMNGYEKSKLFPTDIGMVVNDFLMRYFEQIMDYGFTANVEKEFDEIAEGNLVWNDVIDGFYKPFHSKIEIALNDAERAKGERVLGTDPKTGKQVSVKIGRFGPLAQLGETSEEGEKPQFASLNPGQIIETITLEEALELFNLPRDLGEFENKKVTVAVGRFGPYIRHDNKFVSLKKGVDDPYSVTLERAIELIEEKRESDKNAKLKTFAENADLQILNGRWGPYIKFKKDNFKIPKGTEAEKMSFEDCMRIVEQGAKPKKAKKK